MPTKIRIGIRCGLLLLAATVAPAGNPSVLFCVPQRISYGWVDLDYLNELHAAGFEVDYLPSPFSINEVSSPAALVQEAQSGNALTHAQAENLDPYESKGIFARSLQFCSDGPAPLYDHIQRLTDASG